MNKTIIYTSVGLVVACSIGYMIYAGSKSTSVTITNDFARDDQHVFDVMRADLIAYVNQVHGTYGGWFDDIIKSEYDKGANINGRQSKAAALLAAVNNTDHYPGKRNYYTFLVQKLKDRYK